MAGEPNDEITVNIFGLLISIFIVISLPFLLSFIWIKYKNGKFFAIICGIGGFLSSVFIEGIITYIFSLFLNKNSPLFYVITCISPGLFEETGRYIFFKYVLKNYNHVSTSVSYGIGHGGIESIFVGFSLIGYIVAKKSFIEKKIITQNITFGIGLMSGIERILSMGIHISLSIFVFKAVKEAKTNYYIASIFLHDFVDFFAFLKAVGIINSIVLIESLILVLCSILSLIAYNIYKNMNEIVTDKKSENVDESASPLKDE